MAAMPRALASPLALRPLGLGELLDRSLRIYRANFLTCLGIAALAELPVRLFPLAQPWLARVTGLRLPSNPTINLLGLELVAGLLEVVVIGAMAPLVAGAPTSILGAYRQLARRWRPLLDTLVGVGLYMLAIIVWCVVPLVGWLTGPGALIVYLSLVAPLAGQALVFEQRAGQQAVRRGWDLARRRFWPALRFALILSLLTLVILGSSSVLLNLGLRRLLLGGSLGNPVALAVISALVNLLIGTLALPLAVIGKTLLYIDLRVRTEGLDLALAAQPAGSTAATQAAAATQATAALAEALQASPPALETSGWFSGIEVRRFIGLTTILIAGSALLVVIAALVIVSQFAGRP